MSETDMDTELRTLADLAGIEDAYWDIFGNYHPTSAATRHALLSALGFNTGSAQEIRAGMATMEEAPWRQGIEPVQVFPAASSSESTPDTPELSVVIHLPESALGGMLHWELRLEDGSPLFGENRSGTCRTGEVPIEERRTVDGQPMVRMRLAIPTSLPPGYHRLRVSIGNTVRESLLIATPPRAFLPPWFEAGERRWGIACQLYSLRSEANWGMGDFSDLGKLANQAGHLGASLVGVNPLHVLFPGKPDLASPYSPSSRRFLNPLYVDLTAIEEFGACEEARRLVSRNSLGVGRRFIATLERARESSLVDYPAVAALKLEMLGHLFDTFERLHPADASDDRRREFEAFREEGGSRLRRYALFEVLQRTYPDQAWPDWPEALRNPETAESSGFARDHARDIEFWMYVQWQAERQLAKACDGMRSGVGSVDETEGGKESGAPRGWEQGGLYRDMALGPHPYGADVWGDQALYVQGIQIGAPPDAFNPLGQDWGLPPMNPLLLRARAYAPFIEILRANMHHAAVLRIDHAIGLQHLFWRSNEERDHSGEEPGGSGGEGGGAAERVGAYVRYPMEDLLGILALESVRNRCMIVGEDLGTVPEGFRERLAERGILSYRVFEFERHADGLFHRPDRYPELALTISGTHDMATVRGHWEGRDLELRLSLGLLFPAGDADADPHDALQGARQAREAERTLLLAALRDQGMLDDSRLGEADVGDAYNGEAFADEASIRALILAVQRFLARAPSRLMMVNLEDLLAEGEQVNLPGTIAEYPNWQHKTALLIDRLAEDSFVKALARAVQEERGRAPIIPTR